MHGGAQGSGAPPGNQNALKHGLYTREAFAERQQLGELMRQSHQLIAKIK
jgi:glucans biosynthesis protein